MSIFFFSRPSPSPLFNLSFIFVLAFSLFLSWASSTSPPPPPPPDSVAILLRSRGYSLFASVLENAAADFSLWNATGTLFVPSDAAFTSAAGQLKKRRGPPRASAALLLYHTARQVLGWHDLSSQPDGASFPTFSHHRCLFICRTSAGELCVSAAKKPGKQLVRIRQPNIYVDGDFIVHGIDGVLDPYAASMCTEGMSGHNALPKDSMTSAPMPAPYLEHAVRSLRRRGYGVVARAMGLRRSELTELDAVTVFAPSDETLLTGADGFRYDFRYHVVPQRLHLLDFARLPFGTRIDTLVPGEAIVVGSVNGAVTVNGVVIEQPEIYHNWWVVALAVPRPFQNSEAASSAVTSPENQDSGEFSDHDEISDGVAVSPATTNDQDYSDGGLGNSVVDGDFSLPPTAGDLGLDGAVSPVPATLSDEENERLPGVADTFPSPPSLLSDSGDVRCRVGGDAGCSPAVSPVEFDGAVLVPSGHVQDYCDVLSRDSSGADVAGGSVASPISSIQLMCSHAAPEMSGDSDVA